MLIDIRAMLDQLEIHSADFSAQYLDSTGRTLPMFELPYRETMILVAGYSVPLRAKVVDRWQELEARNAAPAMALPNFMDPAAAAIAWGGLKFGGNLSEGIG
ncbi:MAG TPA: Rha family transcriptional regulator [Burkholderiaceae bacterium]